MELAEAATGSVPFQLQFDKPIPFQIKMAEWNPEKDLLAMVTDDSKVHLHRFNWQRLWTVSPGKSVTSLCWRPDGKAIALGLGDGSISLYANSDSGGARFIVVHNSTMVLAGACPLTASSPLEAELKALLCALTQIQLCGIQVHSIFTDCRHLIDVLYHPDPLVAWRWKSLLDALLHLLSSHHASAIRLIPRELNHVADCLASVALHDRYLSLFHAELDLPRLLMEVCFVEGLFL